MADTRTIAEIFVRECLVITDGTAEAGIARIGKTRFQDVVQKVEKELDAMQPARKVRRG